MASGLEMRSSSVARVPQNCGSMLKPERVDGRPVVRVARLVGCIRHLASYATEASARTRHHEGRFR